MFCLQCCLLRDELNCTCCTGTKRRVWVLHGLHLASQLNSFLNFYNFENAWSSLKVEVTYFNTDKRWLLITMWDTVTTTFSSNFSLYSGSKRRVRKYIICLKQATLGNKEYTALLHSFEMMLSVSAAVLWTLIFLLISPGLNLECHLASELFFKTKQKEEKNSSSKWSFQFN